MAEGGDNVPNYEDVDLAPNPIDEPTYLNTDVERTRVSADEVPRCITGPAVFPRSPPTTQPKSTTLQHHGTPPPVPPRTRRTTVKPTPQHQGVMTGEQKHMLQQNWKLIIDNVTVEDVLDILIQNGVFDFATSQEIKSSPVDRERMTRLMEKLVTRGSRAYDIFLESLKQNCHFVYDEIQASHTRWIEDQRSISQYHEPPMDGEALQNRIRRNLSFMSPGRRKVKQQELSRMEGMGCLSQVPPSKSTQGKMKERYEKDNVVLDKGDAVFIIEQIDGFVNIKTQYCRLRIPDSYVRVHGDPTIERYYSEIDFESNEAKTFIEQSVRKSERNGVFVLYVPTGGCNHQCQFHLCVGFYKRSVVNFHILKKDGYYLQRDEGNDRSHYDGVQSEMRFSTVTDLIDFYSQTSDKTLDGVLQWPMCDAESRLKPEDDFPESVKVLKMSDFTMAGGFGKGYFGNITRGTISIVTGQPVTVAIKSPNKLNQTRAKREELYEEAKILAMFDCENIIKVIGVCFEDTACHLLTEFASKGDLLDVIRKLPKKKKKTKSTPEQSFLNYAQQIASGMKHLEDKNVVHRDLALRNILLFDSGLVKICDFGQARQLPGPDSNYYVTKWDKISPRWTAPEVLATLRYWLQSDIWSFGVLLWELYSYGKTPYQSTDTDDVWGFVVVQDGRLLMPERCPPEIYKMMLSCWTKEFRERPSFGKIYESLAYENYSGFTSGATARFMTEEEYARMLNTSHSIQDYDGYCISSTQQANRTSDHYENPDEMQISSQGVRL